MRFIDITDTRKLHTLPQEIKVKESSEENDETDIDTTVGMKSLRSPVMYRLHMANIEMKPMCEEEERTGLLRFHQMRRRKDKQNEKGKDRDKDNDKDIITESDIWPVLQTQLEFHGHLPHLKEDFEKYKHLLFKPTNEEILGSSRKSSINTNGSGKKENGDNTSTGNSGISVDTSLSQK